MKTKSKTTSALRGLLSGLLLLAAGTSAHAFVTLEWVTVGDAGNANDSTGYGGVAYQYDIMKYEVSNEQYCEFLNNKAASDPNGLYNTNMGSNPNGGITRSGSSGSYTYSTSKPDVPVNYVSTLDAQRFSNWIHNGQGAGDTETGAYAVGNLAIHSGLANVWIPTENEWYKAAYYQPVGAGGDTDSYWLYPTKSNSQPTSASASVITGGANFYFDDGIANGVDGGYAVTQSTVFNSGTDYITKVGYYQSPAASYYGTFDQGGNLAEINDSVVGGINRGVRGGFWGSQESTLRSSTGSNIGPTSETNSLGFRLASAMVSAPEPSRAMLLLGGLMGVVIRRRRR